MAVMKFPLVLLCVSMPFFQNGCATKTVAPQVKGTGSRELVEAWETEAMAGLDEADSPASAEVPIVMFKNPGKGFSKVSWSVGPAGNYRAMQWKGSSGEKMSLRVDGTSGKGPELIDAPSVFTPAAPGESGEEPREWKTVHVPGLKRDLRYHLLDFSFGDTNEQWVSEIFTIISADGSVSSYQATVEVTDAVQVPGLFSKLGLK